MIIDISDDQKHLSGRMSELVQKVLQFAANKEGISEDTEVSISIVDNKEIQALNNQYRQKNRPTDVLSFPLDDEPMVKGMPVILGDIIVSMEKVQEQAKEYHHSYERELCFLIVHGLLHLIGYTHDNETDEKEMFTKQKTILQEFGIDR